jgi:hypothetical protein
MTTRDDLVSRLRAPRLGYGADLAIELDDLCQLAASAFEAKDAEIAGLTATNTELVRQGAYLGDRITDLERQLAEETERCAQIAESGRDHMLRTAQRDEVKHVKHAVDAANIAAGALNEIAAAIRGGRSEADSSTT